MPEETCISVETQVERTSVKGWAYNFGKDVLRGAVEKSDGEESREGLDLEREIGYVEMSLQQD